MSTPTTSPKPLPFKIEYFPPFVLFAKFVVPKRSETGAKVVIVGVFGPYKGPDGQLQEKTYGIDERAVDKAELT